MHKVLAANVWDLPKFEAHIKTVWQRMPVTRVLEEEWCDRQVPHAC